MELLYVRLKLHILASNYEPTMYVKRSGLCVQIRHLICVDVVPRVRDLLISTVVRYTQFVKDRCTEQKFDMHTDSQGIALNAFSCRCCIQLTYARRTGCHARAGLFVTFRAQNNKAGGRQSMRTVGMLCSQSVTDYILFITGTR